MVESGDSLEDKIVMWTDQDLELMVYRLKATGRFDIVPRQDISVKEYVDIGDMPGATSTPVNTVSISLNIWAQGFRNVSPQVPKQDIYQVLVHRVTNPQIHMQKEASSLLPKSHVHF